MFAKLGFTICAQSDTALMSCAMPQSESTALLFTDVDSLSTCFMVMWHLMLIWYVARTGHHGRLYCGCESERCYHMVFDGIGRHGDLLMAG